MNRSTLVPMEVQEKDLATAKRLAAAWAEGEARTYLKCYQEVMTQLEETQGMSLLVSIVNNLLARMKKERQTVHAAANALMKEVESKRTRMFIMAAAVDVLFNERKAGDKVQSLPTMAETLGRVSA